MDEPLSTPATENTSLPLTPVPTSEEHHTTPNTMLEHLRSKSRATLIALLFCLILIIVDILLGAVIVMNLTANRTPEMVPVIAPTATPQVTKTASPSATMTPVPARKVVIPTKKPAATATVKPTVAVPTPTIGSTQNATPTNTATQNTFVNDKEPPQFVSIMGPEEGSTVQFGSNPSCVPIRVSDNVSYYSAIMSRMKLNSGEWSSWGNQHEWCPVFSVGQNTMYFEIQDEVNNTASASKTFTNQ